MRPSIASVSLFIAAAAAFSTADAHAAGSIVGWGWSGAVTAPPPNDDFIAVAAGQFHSLGLTSAGSIVCWGFTGDGQCDIFGPNVGFVQISAGYSHTLALRQDGSVIGFGLAEYEQNTVPAPNAGFVAVAAGLIHSLGLKSNGSIVGWGASHNGQLDVPLPNSGFIAVSGGAYHSAALRADGSVEVFGGGLSTAMVPLPNDDFVAVSAGGFHDLGLKADGSIVSWGDNSHGQLNVPAPNSGFVAVAAGVFHSVGLKADGSVVAWGDNTDGKATITGPNSGFIAVAAGQDHTLALQGQACTDSAECDDNSFCNGVEACSGGVCVSPGNPCASPLLCSESMNQCVSCLTHADCDDGLFCNGAETCTAGGACQSGALPCQGTGVTCDEAANKCNGDEEVWLTFTTNTAVPGLGTVAPQDIVARNINTGAWSLIFDGSDVGLGGAVIDGMARDNLGNIYLSFTEPLNVPGLVGGPSGTLVDDSDIVQFVPSSLGANTAGSFVFYFDGSDMGLTTDSEDIDAIAFNGSGTLIISTTGNFNVPGLNGGGQDLMFFFGNTGANTTGQLYMYVDGSDVGLTTTDENLTGAAILPSGNFLLSTFGNFSVPGASGANEDVLSFTPGNLGNQTSGTYSLYLDLSAMGISTSAAIGSIEYKD